MINHTHIEHSIIALIIQSILLTIFYFFTTLSTSIVILCSLLGLFLFFGREHAQYSQKLKELYGVKNINWKITTKALAIWNWNYDAKMDFFLPCIASFVQALLWLLII